VSHVEGRCVLQTDGACRGNPGPAAGAAVLYGPDGSEIWTGVRVLGHTTNNVAEYEALILGLEAARERCSELTVAADSELIVKQLRGQYRVKQPHLKPLYERASALLREFRKVEMKHVPRSKNERADELANQALDEAASMEPPGERAVKPAAERPVKPAAGLAAQFAANRADAEAKGRYELTVKGHFDAAHFLVGYPGKCKELHGHTWDVELTVSGSRLNEIGILHDFGDLKDLLAEALGPLDHAHLNKVPPFDRLSPTGEHIARYLFDQIEGRLPDDVRLEEVVVWESPVARLAYRRD
jgi:6-pyruvoyltetrahydropterin/6-carboxytetrahydropterin synthase